MYYEILKNNFENLCSLKDGLAILKKIKNSKKIDF